ncbi:MAG: FtsX-like permease family protein [Chloroflexi bacterium]|nr:MAG: FtsX-like permease family protein [Chloroflexota bacterium]
MTAGEIILVAWEGLRRNKVRSLLTMLGVIIGVAAVIVMIAISAGTEATIAEQINSLGANLIFVQGSFGRGPAGGGQDFRLTYDDAVAIVEDIPDVVGMTVEMPSVETIKAGSVTLEDVNILGTTPDFPSVREYGLARGRFFNEAEQDRGVKVAVLGATLAQELFGEEDPIGQKITVGKTKLTVVGVMAEKGVVGDVDFDARLYVPTSVLFRHFVPDRFARVIGNRVRLIYVQAASPDVIDEVILQIQLLLARRHDMAVDDLPITISTQSDIIQTQEATTEAFRSLLAWVAAVSLIVGGIGIMNIMLVSVTERTREIGIRQAVGAAPDDIRRQFLAEALMLSLVGGLIGVLAGIGGALLFGATGGMRTVILPTSLLVSFGSAAAVGVFFGFYPAHKAAQLDPIEALRHE